MKRCWSVDDERGFTLVELMVSIGITAVVLTSLCEIYLLVNREWNSQYGKQQSIIAVSDALDRLSGYVSQSVGVYIHDRFEAGDTLFVCLPADTAGSVYVPTWDGTRYHYRYGQVIIFYLSDQTGSYWNSGDILWAGTVTDWHDFPNSIVPDSGWSLYKDSTTGRITPITYMRFSVDESDSGTVVGMEIGSTYRERNREHFFTQVRSQNLRNEYAL